MEQLLREGYDLLQEGEDYGCTWEINTDVTERILAWFKKVEAALGLPPSRGGDEYNDFTDR